MKTNKIIKSNSGWTPILEPINFGSSKFLMTTKIKYKILISIVSAYCPVKNKYNTHGIKTALIPTTGTKSNNMTVNVIPKAYDISIKVNPIYTINPVKPIMKSWASKYFLTREKNSFFV